MQYINIDRFSGELKARDPKHFKCFNYRQCEVKIEEGDDYYEDDEGRRYCLICGITYVPGAEKKRCEEEDCE